MVNFKQWLEDTGAVTSNLGDTYEQDAFTRKVRSKYVAGEPSPDDDGKSGEEIARQFLGRRAPKFVYRRRKKYMNKSKMQAK